MLFVFCSEIREKPQRNINKAEAAYLRKHNRHSHQYIDQANLTGFQQKRHQKSDIQKSNARSQVGVNGAFDALSCYYAHLVSIPSCLC